MSACAEAIGHYRRKMERHPDEPHVLIHALNKLDRVQGVTIAVLQETRIGRAVNSLKKHSDKRVAALAKHIVEKWKDIVKQEEQDNDDEELEEGHQSQEDEVDDTAGSTNEDSAMVSEENNNVQEEEEEKEDSGHKPPAVNEEEGDVDESRARDSDRRRRHHHKHHKSERRREERHSTSHRKKSSRENKDDAESSRHSRKEKKRHYENKEQSGGNGDAFSEALNGLSNTLATSKTIQKQLTKNANMLATSSSTSSPLSSSSKLPLLSSSSLPDISPNYRPLRRKPDTSPARPKSHVRASDDEALSAVIAMKGKRTAIYSGVKRSGYGTGEVPSLREICLQVLIENVDSIEECGNLTFDILEPVLERASPSTLAKIEEFNPSFIMDTGKLWERFVKKNFPKCEREEMESWREMYERCVRQRDERLVSLQASIMDSYEKEKSTHKKAKLAYVGVVPKAPRSAVRSQIRNGTALPVGQDLTKVSRPISTVPSMPPSGSSNVKKSRVAPLMSKTLKMARGMKGGFRR